MPLWGYAAPLWIGYAAPDMQRVVWLWECAAAPNTPQRGGRTSAPMETGAFFAPSRVDRAARPSRKDLKPHNEEENPSVKSPFFRQLLLKRHGF